MSSISKNNNIYVVVNTNVKILIFTLIALCVYLSTNELLFFTSSLCIIAILSISWRINLPFIITFCLIFQWFQVFANVLFGDFLQLPVNELYHTSNGDFAVYLSLIGILVISIGIYTIVRKIKIPTIQQLQEEVVKFSFRRLIIVYLIISFLYPFLVSFGYQYGGLLQAIYIFLSFKWVLFVIITYHVLLTKKNKNILFLIIAVEFILGLTGYFSSFKTPLLYLVIASLTFKKEVYAKDIIRFLILLGVAVPLILLWQGIKPEYRKILNGGTRQQNVTIGKGDALSTVLDLATNITEEQKKFAVINTFERLAYTQFFSYTLDRVPKILPYENGDLWLNSLGFTFLPRILFPDKGSLDASAKTNRYTGLNFTRAAQGTSVSLGYFVDGYIDFGYVGMFIPLLIIGLIVGFIYWYFVTMKLNLIFNYALISVILLENFMAFEIDGTKLIGGFAVSFVYNAILCIFLYPRLIRWLTYNKEG